MPACHFRAVTDLHGQGKVQLNGQDISMLCRGFAVQVGPSGQQRITLELAAPDVNLNLESAEVELSESSRTALEALGWTHERFIAAARGEVAQAGQQAEAAREAAREARTAAEAQAGTVARLVAENGKLREARTADAAELARLRDEVVRLAAALEIASKTPAPTGGENAP